MMTVLQQMDDLDDAVQVTFCRLFNDGQFVDAITLAKSAKVLAEKRWSGDEEPDVVGRLAKFDKLAQRAEKASKEVI